MASASPPSCPLLSASVDQLATARGDKQRPPFCANEALLVDDAVRLRRERAMLRYPAMFQSRASASTVRLIEKARPARGFLHAAHGGSNDQPCEHHADQPKQYRIDPAKR